MVKRLLVVAMLAIAAPAAADERPLTKPNRDVAVEYKSNALAQSQPDSNATVTMRFASKTGLTRIEGTFGPGYAILDYNAGTVTIVMVEQRMYMQRPADPAMLGLQSPGAVFKKIGPDTVAGIACTTYDATINQQEGQVCLTGDGVLLRARSGTPDHRRELEAVKVTYATQPADLFAPPAGFKKVDASNLPRPPGAPPAAPPPGR
jgi:hypothetical protein